MTRKTNDNYRDELTRLEMLGSDGSPAGLYFVADKGSAEAHIRIALEQAEAYEADAIFFRTFPEDSKRSPLPQIYIYRDTSLDLNESHYATIHCRLWNAGVVPLALIITASQVKILNCRHEPDFDKEHNQPQYTPFHELEKLVKIDRAFVAREVSAGTLWENPKFKNDFCLENTAYYKLLSHLKEFRQDMVEKQIVSEPTVNRILVMAILVKYLDDRRDSSDNRVFQKDFFRKFSHAKNDDLESLFREKGSCVRLLDRLSERFNGGIFELSPEEKSELESADLTLIAEFLKGDTEPNGQGLFWPLYKFQDLPVELISNIYEEFLATRDKDASKGVVYTPPMLVDFLLDQCLPLRAETLSWKIVDPACGSGVFLVGAFKRLIHCWRMANNWHRPTYVDLQNILKNSIHGFDKESEAVLITAFSLCVALCEELDPLVIWNKLKFDNLQKQNLLAKDFFEVIESGQFAEQFDLVIGNPPFDSRLTTRAAERVDSVNIKLRGKLPDKQLALLFLEQSFKLARKDATICLIQPAGPLLYNGNASTFRGYLFNQFAMDQVYDFTALEGVLFKAKVAAAAIIGRNASPTTEKVLHATFRRTRAIKEKLLFELDPYDFHWVTRATLETNKYAWKVNLLGGGRLHRLLGRLFSDVTTLGEYLEEKRQNHGWQFGEGYSVGCGSYLNELPNVKELTKYSPEELKHQFELKRTPKLAPWITGKDNVSPKIFSKNGIDSDRIKPCIELFFEEPRKSTCQIFSPPHVLIKEVVEDITIPAYFSDEELVFTNRIVGIHATTKDKDKLHKIVSRLNDSGLFGILAAVISNQMLVSRATALLKNDIMELPYPDDTCEIELNFWEQALIEDIGNYLIDFRTGGENAAILSETDETDWDFFGEMYCNILNPVYKEFRPLLPIQMGSFICYPFCYGDAPQIELPDNSKIVSFLEELLHKQHSSRLFVHRILRLYDHNVIFMIKPNQKRYWLRSIALRDADETLIDLLEQGF